MDAPARDHEDLLALLAAGVEDCAIMLLDADGHVRTWNERAPRLPGYRAGEIVGRHVSVFYPPEDIEAGNPERELSASAVKGHLENEGWRVLKDGTQVWANVVITALGCHFALDDFGAGFGSFYYLKYLPFDYLKIDGEFVKNCTESRTDQLIIQSCVQLARGLGKQTIAEFVENAEILRLVRALGVDHAQGYEIARPLRVHEVLAPAPLP